MKKAEKRKVALRVGALVMAGLMLLGVAYTAIYYLVMLFA